MCPVYLPLLQLFTDGADSVAVLTIKEYPIDSEIRQAAILAYEKLVLSFILEQRTGLTLTCLGLEGLRT